MAAYQSTPLKKEEPPYESLIVTLLLVQKTLVAPVLLKAVVAPGVGEVEAIALAAAALAVALVVAEVVVMFKTFLKKYSKSKVIK